VFRCGNIVLFFIIFLIVLLYNEGDHLRYIYFLKESVKVLNNFVETIDTLLSNLLKLNITLPGGRSCATIVIGD
jgi:hypothetical protein